MQRTTRFQSLRAPYRSAGCVTVLMAAAITGAAILVGAAPAQAAQPTKAQMKRGKGLYQLTCQDCHQANGQGLFTAYPPLAKVDLAGKHRAQTIEVVLLGLKGELKVNGKTYHGSSPKFDLTDQQVADVLTYVFNTWGNHFGAVTKGEVAAERKKLGATSKKKES